jgi:ADP-ribosyl-[dinitrogen reductase] hydrolase
MTSDDQRDRAIGAMLGLAIGDAVGTTLEFSVRDTRQPVRDMVGGGPFRLKPGEWTDDTAMALCLADSLLACNHLDQRDLMQRFCRWWRNGENSCTGTCFDIGNATRAALIRFEHTGDPVAGSTDPQSAGNGSLMRLAPAAIRHYADLASAIEVARGQSVTTHAAAASVAACAFFTELVVHALNGVDRAALFSPREFLGHREIAAIAKGRYLNKKRSEIKASGYVVHTLEAALWCVHRATDFREAVLVAANLGEDADTVAAVTGQLAGAIWGERGIPQDWRAKLAWRDRIRDGAIRLFEVGTAADLIMRDPSASGKIAAAADNAQARPPLSGRQEMLHGLVKDGTVRMTWAPEVMELPGPVAKSHNCADRIRGMLLGLAIGDRVVFGRIPS